jgi:NagD protein
VSPYYVGKPNPLMMRSALNTLQAHSETAAMIGDRMDTDIVAGLEAGMHTVLVLTGSTALGDTDRYPYRPSRIVQSIADLADDLEHEEGAAVAPGDVAGTADDRGKIG